jgi:hypothetical protein
MGALPECAGRGYLAVLGNPLGEDPTNELSATITALG